jgi:hypothetical protein
MFWFVPSGVTRTTATAVDFGLWWRSIRQKPVRHAWSKWTRHNTSCVRTYLVGWSTLFLFLNNSA